MNTPEQPATPPLTRKQLREIRNTGATPVILPAEADAHAAATREEAAPTSSEDRGLPVDGDAPETADAGSIEDENDLDSDSAPASVAVPVIEAIPAPLPRAADEAKIAETPAPDSSVDLGAAPLTRRQARQQERIRTASVPVITPEIAAASLAGAGARAETERAPESAGDATSEPATDARNAFGQKLGDAGEATDDAEDRPVVGAAFGADLLAGETPAVELPPSFDQLLARSSSGSATASNALIMTQTPEVSALVAPVTATGEVLITGTFNLPEGLGSTGHALGTADGKDVDAVLVDGELPAHSSPTPIAASAAVSTVKTPGEIITPPAPEKGSRLMMTLAITAGALALALVGVLILAFVTGVFA